jgi:hypothetical protein
MGLRSARRQRLEDRIKAIESRDRTNPHTSEYERFHLPARLEAKRLEAAVASLPRSPSIEKTNGVKVRRRAMHKAPYLSFFSFSCRRRTLAGSVFRLDGWSVSVILTSKMRSFPYKHMLPKTVGTVKYSPYTDTPSIFECTYWIWVESYVREIGIKIIIPTKALI